VSDENDDDENVFDQLRDLQYDPELVPDGWGGRAIDFDEWLHMSYPPGDYETHVKALGDADRRLYDALVEERPNVQTILWQAEAQAAATRPGGWRHKERDHCRM
jgi:hypothetical protein